MIPKFRAWYGIEMYDEPVICNGEFYLDWRGFEDGKTYDGAVLMQSTGLKDCNGVELFEGDIVFACDYDDEQGADVYEVCYLEESLEWVLRRIVKEKEFHLSILDWDELEVIGNVYENKELLE